MTDIENAKKVETYRSGIFTFQVGADLQKIEPLLQRVEDAHARFASVPILPDIATRLEREAVVSSVFGTNCSGQVFWATTRKKILSKLKNKLEPTNLLLNGTKPLNEVIRISRKNGKKPTKNISQ